MSIDRKAAVISAIKHQETPLLPYTFDWDEESDIAERLDAFYGSRDWRRRFRSYIVRVGRLEDGRRVRQEGPPLRRNHYGSIWRVDKRPYHLQEPALKRPSLQGYTFPDLDTLFPPEWEKQRYERKLQ